MMHISDKGLARIKRFEGFSPDVYVCSGGRRTIGYGHVIRRISPERPPGSAERRLHQALHDDTPPSEEDASDHQDCRVAERALRRHIRVFLLQHRFDALVSWVFNLGGGTLQASTLGRVINRGHHDRVPSEMYRWVYAGGRRLVGLVRAAHAAPRENEPKRCRSLHMMHISDKGLALIERFEGFSPDVYVCSGGRRTIGYGHVIRRISPECPPGSAEHRLHQALHDDTPLSEKDASDLLHQDCRVAERALRRHIRVFLLQHRFDALVSWVFNLGGGTLQASTLRRVINRGHHDRVPSEMYRWVYAGGRRLVALVRAACAAPRENGLRRVVGVCT